MSIRHIGAILLLPLATTMLLTIPGHVWRIYESDNDVEWIRNFYPKNVRKTHDGYFLTYNVSSSSNEQHVRAHLKIRLKIANNSDHRLAHVYYCYKGNVLNRNLVASENISRFIDVDVSNVFDNAEQMVTFFVELPDIEMSTIIPDAPSLVIFSNSWKSQRRKRSARKPRPRNDSLCRKTSLYVDFEQLSWHDWIIAPKGYEAGQCNGRCPTPMPAHLNATNHAIVQSLLHSINPSQVPEPCCVPTETSPLSVLYMDVDNVIVIKEYADMRVESCGCR